MDLFAKKSIEGLLKESNETSSHSLKKTLGPGKLVALGVGAIIGAGLFPLLVAQLRN